MRLQIDPGLAHQSCLSISAAPSAPTVGACRPPGPSWRLWASPSASDAGQLSYADAVGAPPGRAVGSTGSCNGSLDGRRRSQRRDAADHLALLGHGIGLDRARTDKLATIGSPSLDSDPGTTSRPSAGRSTRPCLPRQSTPPPTKSWAEPRTRPRRSSPSSRPSPEVMRGTGTAGRMGTPPSTEWSRTEPPGDDHGQVHRGPPNLQPPYRLPESKPPRPQVRQRPWLSPSTLKSARRRIGRVHKVVTKPGRHLGGGRYGAWVSSSAALSARCQGNLSRRVPPVPGGWGWNSFGPSRCDSGLPEILDVAPEGEVRSESAVDEWQDDYGDAEAGCLGEDASA